MFSFLSSVLPSFSFFFFNDTATTEIYTLSLHDALPIWPVRSAQLPNRRTRSRVRRFGQSATGPPGHRSEEHTSELQSHLNLVCRLLLEKKKNKRRENTFSSTKDKCI